jgi:hypothetical protein
MTGNPKMKPQPCRFAQRFCFAVGCCEAQASVGWLARQQEGGNYAGAAGLLFRNDAVWPDRKRNDRVAIENEQYAVSIGHPQVENLMAVPQNAF